MREKYYLKDVYRTYCGLPRNLSASASLRHSKSEDIFLGLSVKYVICIPLIGAGKVIGSSVLQFGVNIAPPCRSTLCGLFRYALG